MRELLDFPEPKNRSKPLKQKPAPQKLRRRSSKRKKKKPTCKANWMPAGKRSLRYDSARWKLMIQLPAMQLRPLRTLTAVICSHRLMISVVSSMARKKKKRCWLKNSRRRLSARPRPRNRPKNQEKNATPHLPNGKAEPAIAQGCTERCWHTIRPTILWF